MIKFVVSFFTPRSVRPACISPAFPAARATTPFQPALTQLEPRTLLAAAFWSGGGGDELWSNPANWASGITPSESDDVFIDSTPANPTIRFTAEAGHTRIRSLNIGESLLVTGGTLEVATTARLNAPVALQGGTLRGGTWETLAGPITVSRLGAISHIDGPFTLNGTLAVNTATLRVDPSFTLNGVATITAGALDFKGSATISSGSWVLSNGRLGLARATGAPNPIPSATLTIGLGVGVSGWGTVGTAAFSQGLTTTLINNGTLTANVYGRSLELAPDSAYTATFTNHGVVRATSGGGVLVTAANNTNVLPGDFGFTLRGGTYRADANSAIAWPNLSGFTTNEATIILGGQNSSVTNLLSDIRTNNSVITLMNGMIWSRVFPMSNRGTINLETISSLSISSGGSHTGTFNIAYNSLLTIAGTTDFQPSARLLGQGSLQVTIGNLQLPDVFGANSNVILIVGRNATITFLTSMRLGGITSSGTLNLASHSITLSGALNLNASTALTNITLTPLTGQCGMITAAGALTLNGTLSITSTDFDPSLNGAYLYTAIFFEGASRTGTFTTTNTPAVAAGAYMWIPTASSFELWHNIADFNADGGVDGNDLEVFINAWTEGTNVGDIDGDGGVGGSDIEEFFNLWGMGGR